MNNWMLTALALFSGEIIYLYRKNPSLVCVDDVFRIEVLMEWKVW